MCISDAEDLIYSCALIESYGNKQSVRFNHCRKSQLRFEWLCQTHQSVRSQNLTSDLGA